jgi:Spy/CpxP family protein refolding chaperone
MKTDTQHKTYKKPKELQMKAFKITAIMIFFSTMIFAQSDPSMMSNQRFNDWGDMLDLTIEQQQQMEALRALHMRQNMDAMKEIRILRAEITILINNGGAREDIIAKENLIIEQGAALAQMHLQQHEAMRALLTEAQKVLFDEHVPNFGMRNGSGRGRANRPNHGMGGPMNGSMGGQGGRW